MILSFIFVHKDTKPMEVIKKKKIVKKVVKKKKKSAALAAEKPATEVSKLAVDTPDVIEEPKTEEQKLDVKPEVSPEKNIPSAQCDDNEQNIIPAGDGLGLFQCLIKKRRFTTRSLLKILYVYKCTS